jgi:hypothetical protein
MSTRSTTHFIYGNKSNPVAIIYRHSDGYPEVAGVDIHKFFDECGKLNDSRFTDPSYLAAKYVVFLADIFNTKWNSVTGDSKLQFLSVGVMCSDPGDIEYRYVIDCKNLISGRPTVTCHSVYDANREVPIPTKVTA